MRTPSVTRAVLATAALIAAGGGVVSASTPPGDTTGSDAALEQFEQLAASRGYTLSDPACNATPSADAVDTYTCYAITASGEPFIARTTLGSTDVIEFEIVAEPTQSLGPAAPADTATPDTATSTKPEAASSFDPLAYFDAVFSGDADQMAGLPSQTLAGSPADAYLRYQTEFSETRAEYDATAVEPANVYLTPSGIRVCLTADECVELADFQVIDGQLTNFTVDGHSIAPRLGRTGPVFPVGTGSAQVRAAYHTVSTDELSVFVEVTASTADVFELSAAVYVAPDGTQTPIDTERSTVARNVTMKGTHTLDLQFPGADPGGTVRFLVFPDDGGQPLAAVLPVEPVTP